MLWLKLFVSSESLVVVLVLASSVLELEPLEEKPDDQLAEPLTVPPLAAQVEPSAERSSVTDTVTVSVSDESVVTLPESCCVKPPDAEADPLHEYDPLA